MWCNFRAQNTQKCVCGPDHTRGAYSTPPDHIAGFQRAVSWRQEKRGGEEGWKGKRKGRKHSPTSYLQFNQYTQQMKIRHCGLTEVAVQC